MYTRRETIARTASALGAAALLSGRGEAAAKSFDVLETTIGAVHAAFRKGKLTARELTQSYIDRIEAFDKNGPKINSVIAVNPAALADADRLDAQFKKSGLVGPLHGIPILLKDQVDVAGMPTTLGSVVFKDNVATRDAFIVERMRKAGAIILGKATLAEFAAGDTFGSLFGETRNPYDLDRTVGGSSGGSAAAAAANFCTVAVGQEGLASIRRPSAWNSVAGMRPTPGLVSRSGGYGGWPSVVGSLGPIARTVEDLAKLLDVLVGYDADDPVTALGVGQAPATYTKFLETDGLKGARIGILRESIGLESEPDSADFQEVTAAFDRSLTELKRAGAELVDPIVIPKLKESVAKRGAGTIGGEGARDGMEVWLSRNPNSKFKNMRDVRRRLISARCFRGGSPPDPWTGRTRRSLKLARSSQFKPGMSCTSASCK